MKFGSEAIIIDGDVILPFHVDEVVFYNSIVESK